MELSPYIDHMVLFSGDGDFRPLVAAMQRRGVRVTVVSTVQTQPPMVADELRRQADDFVDIVQLIPRIGRDQGDRPARPPRSLGPDGPRDAAPRDPAPRTTVNLENRYGIRQPDEDDAED